MEAAQHFETDQSIATDAIMRQPLSALASEQPEDAQLGTRDDEAIDLQHIPGRARIANAEVSYTLHLPVNEVDITDPRPLVIAHGWGGPELAYTGLGTAVAHRGKPSLTYNAPRSKGAHDLNPLHLLQVAKLSSQAAWSVMRQAGEDFGYDLFDIYGHSLGGETAVNVATHKPEHTRSVILDGSCGLDIHSLREMIGRTGEFGKRELYPALGKIAMHSDPRIGLQALHYIFRNPSRTLAEGLNAGSTNLHGRLQQLSELGIVKAAIQSPNDIYFPIGDVERDARHLFDAFFTRHDPEANHLAPILDPIGTAEAVINLLSELHPRPALKAVA